MRLRLSYLSLYSSLDGPWGDIVSCSYCYVVQILPRNRIFQKFISCVTDGRTDRRPDTPSFTYRDQRTHQKRKSEKRSKNDDGRGGVRRKLFGNFSCRENFLALRQFLSIWSFSFNNGKLNPEYVSVFFLLLSHCYCRRSLSNGLILNGKGCMLPTEF